jgi:hypothetical protein
MGSDIRGFIEYRDTASSEEEFIYYEEVYFQRYCHFYDLMAHRDVVYLRQPLFLEDPFELSHSFKLCRHEYVINPRGLPTNISSQGQDQYDADKKMYDAIQHKNWLSLQEVEEIQRQIKGFCCHAAYQLEPVITKIRCAVRDGFDYTQLLQEIEELRQRFQNVCSHTDPHLEPVIEQMRTLEKNETKYSRLVFWYSLSIP